MIKKDNMPRINYLLFVAAMICCYAEANAQIYNASEYADSTSIPMTADELQHQAIKSSQKLMMVGGETVSSTQAHQDSVRELMERFYIDQYHHFQDPEAPYFLLMSRDATLAMGIGGAVRMRGWYDFGGAVPYNGFIPYTIPVPGDPETRRAIKSTPAGTALFMRIIGTNKKFGKFSAFIQGNFDGTDNTFKLKKSYVTINDWTIGYTTSTLSDIAANPPVIDASGPNGQVNNTSLLLQWRHRVHRRWEVAASVEFPKSQVDTDDTNTRKIDDWLPDVVAYTQYEWMRGAGHVRLSGLLRVLPYRDLHAGKNRNKMGFGFQVSTVAPVAYDWTVYAEAVGGRGCESYLNDFMVSSLDLVNDPERPGRMYAPWCYGLTAGVKYNILPGLIASVSASEARLYGGRGIAADGYKYGLYGLCNVVWNMSPRLQVGAEYLMGKRKNQNGESGCAQRVNLLFQFSF